MAPFKREKHGQTRYLLKIQILQLIELFVEIVDRI